MVGADGAGEISFLVGSDAGGHVGLAVVVEGLAELGDGALDVSEVGEGDVFGEFSNADWDVLAAGGEGALAVAELVGGAGVEVEDALEGLVIDDDAVLAVEIGQGWVVGMEGEGDAVVFGERGDFFEEVGEVLPELLGGGGIGLGLGVCSEGNCDFGEIEFGDEGSASFLGGE